MRPTSGFGLNIFIILPILFSTIFLFACQSEAVEYHECGILDTCISLTIKDKDHNKARRALATAVSDIRRLQRMVHPTQSGGMLRTNALIKSGEWFSVNPSLFNLIKESKKLYRTSKGYYNPAAGNMDAASPARETTKDDKATMDDIEFEGIRVRSKNPQVKLDFGYALHGHVVDTIIDYLNSIEIENALLQVGSIYKGLSRGKTWQLKLPLKTQPTVLLGHNKSACLLEKSDHADLPFKLLLVIHETALGAAAVCMALKTSGKSGDLGLARMMGAERVLLLDLENRFYRHDNQETGSKKGLKPQVLVQTGAYR